MSDAPTHCAKCGAELIGARKFCTACGAPTTDPRATGPNAAKLAPPSTPPAAADARPSNYGAPPPSQVNPFAQTAVPKDSFRAESYGPPPAPLPAAGQPPPSRAPSAPPGSAVSPLAMSNVMSQSEVLLPQGGSHAGTQAMPSVPNPPAAPAPEAKRGHDRTQVMGAVAFPIAPAAGSGSAFGPAPSQAAPSAQPAPHAYAPSAAHAHGGAYAAPAQAPAAPTYGAPPAAFAAYPPGSRVLVMWADGRRYPGVVHQISGTVHLVVFPDGQQHWVEQAYLSPA